MRNNIKECENTVFTLLRVSQKQTVEKSGESGFCQLPEGTGQKADQIGRSNAVFSGGMPGEISCQTVEKDRAAR